MLDSYDILSDYADGDYRFYVVQQQFPPFSGPQFEEHRLCDQAQRALRNYYAEGIPFFTKESIQDIVDQIDRGTTVISVAGLDGSELEFPIRTGELYPVSTGRDSVLVMQVLSWGTKSTYVWVNRNEY